MAPAIYFSLRASVTAPQKRYYFHTTERVEFPGWKVVGGYMKVNNIYDYLLTLPSGTLLSYSKINSSYKLKELKKTLY